MIARALLEVAEFAAKFPPRAAEEVAEARRRMIAEEAAELEEPPSTWSDWSRTCEYKHDHWRMGIGKHKGVRLDRVPRDCLRWMLREDFAPSTKDLVRGFLR